MASENKILATATPVDIREELNELIVKDLLGPAGGPEEELDQSEDHAYSRYLVGMLAPKSARVEAEELDELGDAEPDDAEAGKTDMSAPPTDSFFPTAMGMSFMVKPETKLIEIQTEWGRYRKEESPTQKKKEGAPARVFFRRPVQGNAVVLPMQDGTFGPVVPQLEDPNVVLQGRMRQTENGWLVTLFMLNIQDEPDKKKDAAWVFQPKMSVTSDGAIPQPIFVQRRNWKHDLTKMDPLTREETESLEMLYRRRLEFAVGHGVSVRVTLPESGHVHATKIETTFIPQEEVEQQTPPTAADNSDIANVILDMKTLAEMTKSELMANLRRIETAYAHWIVREQAKISNPAERLADYKTAADRAISRCQRTCARIREGIDLIEKDALAEKSFRFANRVMARQRVRSIYAREVRKSKIPAGAPETVFDETKNRSWRLFQVAFILLNIPSITNLQHPDRSDEKEAIADLLWFATGGGKTEAYLGLTAYVLALRRLQGEIEGRAGDHGVAVLMRYTLRLLTLQQFQRATALLCACEIVRRDDEKTWGKVPFRLGLWVGGKTTPNALKHAAEALRQGQLGGVPGGGGTPHQIVSCPWCGHEIKKSNISVDEAPKGSGRCITYCGDPLGRCEFSQAKAPQEGLPVMVVDEDIYRRPPSLLIATVDKFAQMAWKGETQMLFGQVNGLCPRHGFLSPEIDDSGKHNATGNFPGTTRQPHGPLRPPDLIIQDELHLISGPLGSMVALYETAVDTLCSWEVNGKLVRPKVIASTATIRRAQDQVLKLFARKLEVFPPQGTSSEDSFFAIQRRAGAEHPGRRYLGICPFGRRYPVAMIRVYQAAMAASQVLFEKYGRPADPWMTMTGYFNSVRELAGTRRLVEDDIRSRLRDANQRGLAKRKIHYSAVEELTSRKSGSDIPKILERLEIPFDETLEAQREEDRKNNKPTTPRPYDVVLATNMISVGVDIERLGLMVVAGQPKTTSEYIQATSRVGRSKNGPGLVITLFNWARPRDLSHYETFEHYHETFYKHVEPLSVTPFSPRALDRGLTGVLVGLLRLMDASLNANIRAGELKADDPLLTKAMEIIMRRAELANGPSVHHQVKSQLMERRDAWLKRVLRQTDHRLGYQDGAENIVGLLKQAGDEDWEMFTCLNSLRDVEGTVDLILSDNPAGLLATPVKGEDHE